MKYPANQYGELKNALNIFKTRYNLERDRMQEIAQTLHLKIYQQKNYNDTNANVIFKEDGSRLFEINESFKLYPDNCTDAHIKTALKNAINEIFN